MYCDTRETNCYLINQHEKSKKVIQPKHNIRTQSHPKERKTELVYWEGVCVCGGGTKSKIYPIVTAEVVLQA